MCSSKDLIVDYMPNTEDEGRLEKCTSFWKFVISNPHLARLKVYPIPEDSSMKSDSSTETSMVDECDSKYCLNMLDQLEERGITKQVLSTEPRCGRCLPSPVQTPARTPSSRALAREMDAWDSTAQVWSVTDRQRPSRALAHAPTCLPCPCDNQCARVGGPHH